MDFEHTACYFITNFEINKYALRKGLFPADSDVKTMVAFLNYPSIFGGIDILICCKLITLEGQGPIKIERLIEDMFSLNLDGRWT